jgi:glycosyltransferase involved in cell wall biosynthesis
MGEERITVFQVIYGLCMGGAEQLLLPLATKIDASRFRTVVVAIDCSGPLEKILAQKGVEVFVLGKHGKFNLGRGTGLIKAMQQYSTSLLHSHLFCADFWSGVSCTFLPKVKHISTVHGLPPFTGPNLFSKSQHWIGAVFPDHIIAVCEETAQRCVKELGIKREKISVIHNGIEPAPYRHLKNRAAVRHTLSLAPRQFVLGFVGRLEPQKNLPFLLKAMKRLKEEGLDAITLLIAGSGSQEATLRTLVQAGGLQETVHLLGLREDIPDLLSALDVFVLPSVWEGLSVAAMEAMAAGLAVIATPVGGNPELIQDNQTGILVPCQDVKALAEAIKRLYLDPALREKMSSRGRERIEGYFNHERMVTQIQDLYEQILRK